MRWIVLALVTTTLTCASPIGSTQLPLLTQKDSNAYGSVDGSCGQPAPQTARNALSPRAGAEVSALTNILRDYTDDDDALRTAVRYHKRTDDPALWTAITIVESGCNSNVVSPSGAQGKLQVMPFWKNTPGFEFYRGKNSHLNDDLNFRAAYKVYRMLKREHNGDKWRAVERYCGTGPDARVYVSRVREVYKKIKAATEQAMLNETRPEKSQRHDPSLNRA